MRMRRLRGAYARQASALTKLLFGVFAALLVVAFSPLKLLLRAERHGR
jgi:hypothetical protein